MFNSNLIFKDAYFFKIAAEAMKRRRQNRVTPSVAERHPFPIPFIQFKSIS
jgi:hypothetical protein